MTTDTPKTTEQQEQWVLAVPAPSGVYSAIGQSPNFVLVNTDDKSRDGIKRAMSDPANVLNVDAYPGVVKALKRCKDVIAEFLCQCSNQEIDESFGGFSEARLEAYNALTAVHPAPAPAEGGKT